MKTYYFKHTLKSGKVETHKIEASSKDEAIKMAAEIARARIQINDQC